MQDHSTERLAEARGLPVYASGGEQIGKLDEIFYDAETQKPEWIGVGTGFFGKKRVLVPVRGADMRDDGCFVPYERSQVEESPDIRSDEIDQKTEAELSAHYGLEYSKRQSDSGLPEGEPPAETQAGDLTRHEEELKVGKRPVEAGRVRLRKWVETEPVEMSVDLQRETARVTRESMDEPVGDAEIGEEEVEVRLRGEEPVVQKQTVAKERVGVEKDVETERQTVRDEVRKERVDLDEEPA